MGVGRGELWRRPGLTLLPLVLLRIFWNVPKALIAGQLGSAPPGDLALCLDHLACAGALFALSAGSLIHTSISIVSKRFGRPIAAILLMAVLNAVPIVGPFQNLVVIDVILSISARVLIFISAVRLRIKEPDLKRPLSVLSRIAGMVARMVPPILIVQFAIYVNAIVRSTVLLGFDGFDPRGVDAA